MSRRIALSLALLVALSPLRVHARTQGKPAQPFAIDFPEDVSIKNIQAKYFIAGGSEAYGDLVFTKAGEHRILLHPPGTKWPAESLRAVLYVPGCQIVAIAFPDLQESSRERAFECQLLPKVAFTGGIRSDAPITDPDAVVDVEYVVPWSRLPFFGVSGGYISSFQIATVPLEPGLEFHLELPDFSQDPFTNSQTEFSSEARLRFVVRDGKTWNTLGKLAPQGFVWLGDDLPIASPYPTEVLFTYCKL